MKNFHKFLSYINRFSDKATYIKRQGDSLEQALSIIPQSVVSEFYKLSTTSYSTLCVLMLAQHFRKYGNRCVHSFDAASYREFVDDEAKSVKVNRNNPDLLFEDTQSFGTHEIAKWYVNGVAVDDSRLIYDAIANYSLGRDWRNWTPEEQLLIEMALT